VIVYINRWVLLAALAGGPATTWPVAAHAQSLDQVQPTAAYALADALIPYAQRDFVRALELLAPLVVFMLLSCLFAYPTARRAAAWLLGIATTVVVAGGIQTWGHKGWSLMAFDAEVPEISRPSATTALIVRGDPAWAWLAAMSWRNRCRSNSMEALISSMMASGCSLKRPPHILLLMT